MTKLPNLVAFSLVSLAFLQGTALAEKGRVLDCTVIIDEASGETLHREGTCDQPFSPMSTFKLPLAMMGYDAGILTDEKNPRWDYKPQYNRSKREQRATDPTIWEKESIVWYSQEITRKLGMKRFADYVKTFGYGNADVRGGPGGTDGLTESWLMSSLVITPDQQVQFLRRFLTTALPLSDHATDMTLAITPTFQAKDGWTIQGKTGSGSLRGTNGKTDPAQPIGWFVGWATKGDERVIFARLRIRNERPAEPLSLETRDTLIADFPKLAETF